MKKIKKTLGLLFILLILSITAVFADAPSLIARQVSGVEAFNARSESLVSVSLEKRTAAKKKKTTAASSKETKTTQEKKDDAETEIQKDGSYTSKDEVAAYIHLYGELPGNYITKNEARDLGWVSSKGNLDKVAPGKSIGGDKFGNYEKLLPTKKGRQYYECDIDYEGGTRNAKRIIYSNDGLIFYTEDHYNTFEQLY